jgi:hypothetical protein
MASMPDRLPPLNAASASPISSGRFRTEALNALFRTQGADLHCPGREPDVAADVAAASRSRA